MITPRSTVAVICIGADGWTEVELASGKQLTVYLYGTTLPDEVYAALDFEALVQQLTDAAGPDSHHGSWQGPEETGPFFFGADAEGMWARVEPVLRVLPIGQNARVVVRPGTGLTDARTIRLPRHCMLRRLL